MAQFIIAKHRSGGLEDINLRFEANLVRFEEPESIYNTPSSPKPLTPQTYTSRMKNNGNASEEAQDNSDKPDFTATPLDQSPF